MVAVAIMQPYAFPYIGYFHLIQACDYFVFYDDVTYIKQGWINRNRILINGREHLFTLPVQNHSSNSLIKDIQIASRERFQKKFHKTISQSYKKAPNYVNGIQYIDSVFSYDTNNIAEICMRTIDELNTILGTKREWLLSSKIVPRTPKLGRAERLIAIAKQLGATQYVNPIGGKGLYNKTKFLEEGLDLRFVNSRFHEYPQIGVHHFVPKLSIIDVIMNNNIQHLKDQMQSFSIE